MENAKRNPRTIALEKNQRKPAGAPAFDRNTGAPCPQDHVKGDYRSWGQQADVSSDDGADNQGGV